MKKHILFGLLAIMATVFVASCSDDDDYTAATGALVSGVTTGSADVTANSATLHATVDGDLSHVAATSYQVAFKFGPSADAMTRTATSLSGQEFAVTIDGLLENVTYYYQAQLTLQGKVTYEGEVRTLVTTDARVTTADPQGGLMQAVLGGSVSNMPTGGQLSTGIVLSTESAVEAVRGGLVVTTSEAAASFSLTQKGLLPGMTYYYAAFLNLGAGTVYGDVKSFTTTEKTLDVDADFVDLGLSTRWCRFNIGAASETDLGGLFGFGDLTGTNNSTEPADYASADIYKTALDIANQTYQQTTLPSAAEFEELFQRCSYEWIEKEGVSGLEFTGPNGAKLFLPAAGERKGNDVSGVGTLGAYLTGSVNAAASSACDAYRFSQRGGSRAASATSTALSVRPVTTAKNVAFKKELLCNTWHIDLSSEGTHVHFAGPMYFYGTADSWASITNGEPVIGDSWGWEADYAGNSWVVGEDPRDFGSITFTADGRVTVVTNAADGTQTTEEGTYTVDEAAKTVTMTVGLLGLPSQIGKTADAKTNLKILSMTDETLQIAVLRDPALSGEGACLLAFNYVPDNLYRALSFPVEKIYNTWVIDINPDGTSNRFVGPLGYYGTDDSWATVTNGVSVGGDSWNWTPDYAGNSWILGDNAPRCFGRMTLREDGTVTVVRTDADGNKTSESGTYTVDKANKTISLSVDVLGLPNMQALTLTNQTNLKILSLTDETLQVAILRDPALSGEGACLLSFNYVTDAVYSGGMPLGNLYNTWHLDIRPDGTSTRFVGPLSYCGTGDWWGNVSEGGEPLNSDSWNWTPDYAGNSWILGDNAPRDFGAMTFAENGTVTVTRVAADGSKTTEEGTFTVDGTAKTITLSVDVLGLPNMQALTLTNKDQLRILMLTDNQLEIAILRDPTLSGEGACLLTFNYVPESVYVSASRKRK